MMYTQNINHYETLIQMLKGHIVLPPCPLGQKHLYKHKFS